MSTPRLRPSAVRWAEMRIAVIGLGIIGGSLCKAFREYTGHYVMGYNRTAAVAQRALELGAVHEICTPEALKLSLIHI